MKKDIVVYWKRVNTSEVNRVLPLFGLFDSELLIIL